jgi:hypothetical protein
MSLCATRFYLYGGCVFLLGLIGAAKPVQKRAQVGMRIYRWSERYGSAIVRDRRYCVSARPDGICKVRAECWTVRGAPARFGEVRGSERMLTLGAQSDTHVVMRGGGKLG